MVMVGRKYLAYPMAMVKTKLTSHLALGVRTNEISYPKESVLHPSTTLCICSIFVIYYMDLCDINTLIEIC